MANRFLYLQTRHLGDAVIGTSVIEAIGRSFQNAHITVLTREPLGEIYRFNPFVAEMHFASFPIGPPAKDFRIREALHLMHEIVQLRRRAFDRVIHLSGDYRENIIGWAVSPSGNTGVTWPQGHPQHRMVRAGATRTIAHPVLIPAQATNIYAAAQGLATGLGACAPAHPRIYAASGEPWMHQLGGDAIGIHPFASHECRMWSYDNWHALVKCIRAQGLKVILFGAASDRQVLNQKMGGVLGDSGVSVVAGPLAKFFDALTRVKALVCLDTFSVHAAYAIGVPCVMINGANMASVWAPPRVEVVENSTPPQCYPCINTPSCLSSEAPYSCIREITVGAVVTALKRIHAMS